MSNFYTRTEVPDNNSYVPSKSAKDFKVGNSYEFLFWNGARLTRDSNGNISDDQIPVSFYILEGEIIEIDNRVLEVSFSKGLNNPINKTYSLNDDDTKYLYTWKKLVEFTKRSGKKTGLTEDGGSTIKGLTEDTPQKVTGRGVTEDMPKGVTEDV